MRWLLIIKLFTSYLTLFWFYNHVCVCFFLLRSVVLVMTDKERKRGNCVERLLSFLFSLVSASSWATHLVFFRVCLSSCSLEVERRIQCWKCTAERNRLLCPVTASTLKVELFLFFWIWLSTAKFYLKEKDACFLCFVHAGCHLNPVQR